MTYFFVAALIIVAWRAGMRTVESRVRRRLEARESTDWVELSRSMIGEGIVPRAIDLVLSVVTDCLRVEREKISPNDDINITYNAGGVFGALSMEDHGEEIIEMLREKLDRELICWNSAECGDRVGDLMRSISAQMRTNEVHPGIPG